MIETSAAGGVFTITLGRAAAKNALDLGMVRALRAALATATQDGVTRAVVLRSAVEGYFSIGMDLGALDASMADGERAARAPLVTRDYIGLLTDVLTAPVPTIALVNGVAIGGGVDLTASCDLAIASEAAVFSIALLRQGIFPLTTSGVVVPRIGQREFTYWLVSGQYYPARKARRLGLVSEVVAPEALEARGAELAARIVALDGPAFRLGMEALRLSSGLSQLDRLKHLGALLALNVQLPMPARAEPRR